VNEATWVDRASRRLDAWPVGPLAALLLGAATGFFCWAMPYSPTIGRIALIVAPALLAFLSTLAIFRWIDARDRQAVIDEGDDQEDWLTRPVRPRRAPAPAAETDPSRPGARPLIIEAIEDDEAGPALVSEGGWPLPLVDRVSPAPSAPPADELLLDAPLHTEEDSPALPIEDLMARLAQRIEGRTDAAVPLRPAPPSMPPPAAPVSPPPLSDAEALRAALADLHRMAHRS
jgi:hypothetical protein